MKTAALLLLTVLLTAVAVHAELPTVGTIVSHDPAFDQNDRLLCREHCDRRVPPPHLPTSLAFNPVTGPQPFLFTPLVVEA